jgi:hypothetical protein
MKQLEKRRRRKRNDQIDFDRSVNSRKYTHTVPYVDEIKQPTNTTDINLYCKNIDIQGFFSFSFLFSLIHIMTYLFFHIINQKTNKTFDRQTSYMSLHVLFEQEKKKYKKKKKKKLHARIHRFVLYLR